MEWLSLHFRPRAPVALLDFADDQKREAWIRDKGLTVFSLWSPDFPGTELDLFVSEPFDFGEARARAERMPIGGITVSVASIGDLVAMKRVAGRARDLEDIEALERILRLKQSSDT